MNALGAANAPNHVEFGVQHETVGAFTITVQRANGETPGAKAARLSAETLSLCAALDAAEASLKKSQQAISDWTCTYASDMCRPENVKAANDRIGEVGTIYYQANVNQTIQSALAAIQKVK